MKLSELIPLLREFVGSVSIRPDATGVRGHGAWEDPISRDDSFPYDKVPAVGQPNHSTGIGQGSSGQMRNPIVPKDTSHSAWDDLEEAQGTPMLLSKAYQGGQTHTGIPGASKGWSGNPPKDWDPEEDHASVIPHRSEEFDPTVPPTEPVPTTGIPDPRGQTDDSIENLINRIWGLENNPSALGAMLPSTIHIISSPAPVSPPRGLMSQGSAWSPLEILAKKL